MLRTNYQLFMAASVSDQLLPVEGRSWIFRQDLRREKE
jgi:hypothetical protein